MTLLRALGIDVRLSLWVFGGAILEWGRTFLAALGTTAQRLSTTLHLITHVDQRSRFRKSNWLRCAGRS
jgi:hypothetical protein